MMQRYQFSTSELPEDLQWQILDFIRVTWPDGFMEEHGNLYRDWISKSEDHPVHFCLVGDKRQLIAYVGVVWKQLQHAGQTYKLYGLSGVFTYPQFRGKRFGLELVKSAREYILAQDGDVLLLTTELNGFYEKAGFVETPEVVILEGDEARPEKHEAKIFLEALSPKAKANWMDLIGKPIYFGECVW